MGSGPPRGLNHMGGKVSLPLHITTSHSLSDSELTLSVWVCLAALSILDSLHIVDTPTLAAWLSERQLPSGGLNGRPEKLEDVCYSWWDLASLSILGRLNWINRDKLIGFILDSQVRSPYTPLLQTIGGICGCYHIMKTLWWSGYMGLADWYRISKMGV